MTYDELKALVAETSAALNKINADVAASQKKTDRQIAETNATLKALGIFAENTNQHVDGIGKTSGLEAEEFFYSSLKRKPKLGGIQFDLIGKRMSRARRGKHHEIDILLENEDTVAIVEAKNKVKQDTIDQLDKTIQRFATFYPSFKNHKIYGAIAGKVFPNHLQAQALKKGYFVLTQQGDHVKQRSPG